MFYFLVFPKYSKKSSENFPMSIKLGSSLKFFSFIHTMLPSKSTIIRFDLSKYFNIALILSNVNWGVKIFLRSLNLGNGVISLILFKKYSTSGSEKSFEADRFLFLLIFFLRIQILQSFIK